MHLKLGIQLKQEKMYKQKNLKFQLFIQLFNLFFLSENLMSQTWNTRQSLPSTTRTSAGAFAIGNDGYIIGGEVATGGAIADFWKYNSLANNWSSMPAFPGVARTKPASFSINDIGYYGLGTDPSFYKFDPSLNQWLQLATPTFNLNYWNTTYFTIGTDAYFLPVNSTTVLKYNTLTNTWSTLATNFPGVTRSGAVGFSINGKGYISCGLNTFANPYLTDLWEFDPVTTNWIQKASLPATGRYASTGYAMNGKGYILCGERYNPNTTLNEFWQYNPVSNTWLQLSNFLGGNRNYLAGFVINNNIYAGMGSPGYSVDFYMYGTICNTSNTPVMTNSSTASICSGTSVNFPLTASLASSFTWLANATTNVTGETTTSTSGATITDLLINSTNAPQTVTYTVTPTSTLGCVGIPQTVSITVNPTPIVNAGLDQNVCAGNQVLLSASGANSYTWSNGVVNNIPFIPASTSTYTVTGVNSFGCSASDQVLVTVLPLPLINAGPDQTICNGNSVTLNATGGFSLTWNNGVINGVPFTPSPGIHTYTVIGTGSNGCTNSDYVVINVNPSGTINAGPDITICPGDSVTLFVPIDTTTTTTFSSTSGTYIADFSSQPYGNNIQVSGLPSGSTITSAGDLSQICMDIEHSYLGDLDIWLQCPNGQIAPLVNAYNQGTGGFLPGGVSGGSVFLGDPIDDITGPPGTGWQYCFSSTNNTTGLFTSNIFNTIPLSTANGNNSNGYSMDPSPIYYPEASFSNLIGCPVNGTWTIFIQDEWQVDDGYLFNWSMNFTNSLNPGALISAQWSNGISYGVPFSPITSGTYTITGTTASGCTVTDQVNVTVSPLSSCVSGGGFLDVPTFLPFSQDNFIATVIDHNNDGVDDVYGYIMSQPNSNRLWINNGNSTFTDISTSTNFPVRNNARVIDLDKNGWSDIYYIVGDSVIVHYNMNGTYQAPSGNCAIFSISSLFGIGVSSIKQVQFADFNNDGVYDLLVQVQNGNQSQLRAIEGQLGCQLSCPYALGFGINTLITVNTLNYVESKFADLDNDFDMDIILNYAVNQYQNATYQMYRNDGTGLFTQLSGTGYQLGRSNAFGTVGELNNDGFPDIISGAADCCVQGDPLYLHLSNNGVFSYNVSTSAIPRHLDPYYQTASLVDLNLDTKKDIVWVSLAAIGSSALQYHVNNGNGTFTESAASYNIDEGPSTGQCCPIKNTMHAVIIDINNDEKPDLDIHELDNVAPYTFVNNWTKFNNSNLNVVKLKLQACVGLREGWGARLAYKTGGQWHHQQHTANTQDNYPFLYLGMGTNTSIDSLIIYWIGGNTTTLTNITSNQYISLSESPFCSFAQTNAQIIPNNPQVICSNQSTVLTANVQNINSIQWFVNGQAIVGANGTTYNANSVGTYSFIANNGTLCNVSSDSVFIDVLQAPDVFIDPINNDTLCNTECAFLIASGAQQYDWFDGTTLYHNEVHTSGNYYVVGTNANGCQDTATIQMIINPSNDTTIYVSALNSYDLNGITYTSSGLYQQVLTNVYGCDSTINLDLDLSFAGIDETGNSISIFPNPTTESLNVDADFIMKSDYIIIDVRGRIILKDKVEGKNSKIDVSSLAPGCYTIQFDKINFKLNFIKQ